METRMEKWKIKREEMGKDLTKKELEKFLFEKLKEIKDAYYSNYDKADYLSMALFKDGGYITIRNDFTGVDREYPIDITVWEDRDGQVL